MAIRNSIPCHREMTPFQKLFYPWKHPNHPWSPSTLPLHNPPLPLLNTKHLLLAYTSLQFPISKEDFFHSQIYNTIFPIRALLRMDKFMMPKPPLSSSMQAIDQFTICGLRSKAPPPQRKSSWIFSSPSLQYWKPLFLLLLLFVMMGWSPF